MASPTVPIEGVSPAGGRALKVFPLLVKVGRGWTRSAGDSLAAVPYCRVVPGNSRVLPELGLLVR